MEPREDIEHLLLIDRLPPEVLPLYDTVHMSRIRVKPIRLESPWNEVPGLLRDELRSEIVQKLMEVRDSKNPIRPFNLSTAQHAIGVFDLVLQNFLVHPDFVPLLGKVARHPCLGVGGWLRIFTHYEMSQGEIFAFPEPQFFGVVAIHRGQPGVLITNPAAMIWGSFPRRGGV
jgi:hypothetical protein